jgi:pimeloyl-ACP methyl ester carboxylesterase
MHFPVDPGAPRHDVPAHGRSGFVVIDERQVHYLEWGRASAPPVVCLHGGGQTAYMWEELGAALTDRYHVLAPDLPGHGDSDPIDAIDRNVFAATLPGLFAEFGIERAALVGASLGGWVSLALAVSRPELVAGIALVDIGHRLEDEGVDRIIDFMRRHESFVDLDEAAAAVREFQPKRKDVKVENLRRNLRQRPDGRWEWKHMFGKRLREDGTQPELGGWRALAAGLEDEVTTLTCPVLILRGRESDVLSDEGAEELAALITNAQLARISGAGHLAAGDNPTTVVSLVSQFFVEMGW